MTGPLNTIFARDSGETPISPMNVEVPDAASDRHWFAVRVKSRHEKIVAGVARNKGFEQFLPLNRCHHRWSDRVKSVELPLFPGSLFCRLTPGHRVRLLTIPVVVYLVGVGETAVVSADH